MIFLLSTTHVIVTFETDNVVTGDVFVSQNLLLSTVNVEQSVEGDVRIGNNPELTTASVRRAR